MIVKIQQSLYSSSGSKEVLIYDKEHKFNHITSEPKEIKPILQLLGKRPKAYFKTEIVEKRLQIGMEVPEQDW